MILVIFIITLLFSTVVNASNIISPPPTSRVTLHVLASDRTYESRGYGTVSDAEIIESAMALWNQVGVGVGVDHEFFRVIHEPHNVPTDCGLSTADGWDTIAFSPPQCSLTFVSQSGGPDALAVSFRGGVSSEGPQTAVGFDIRFNGSVQWGAYQGPTTQPVYDTFRVVLHELGHLIGLNHVVDIPSIMRATLGDEDTIQPYDENTAHSISYTPDAFDIPEGRLPVFSLTPIVAVIETDLDGPDLQLLQSNYHIIHSVRMEIDFAQRFA